ncbi:MAG: M20 family metallopeptidase [Spirochaetaceae bacterium]
MNNFYLALNDEIDKLLPEIKKLRKELHKNPETAWNEFETRRRLIEVLGDCNINIHKPYLETDIVFDFGDTSKQEALLLRSDMDALCQDETGNKPYKSINKGAAHSCGHDGHMSMLSGAALIIDRLIKNGYPLPRPVRFVFQPAEEIECGGSKLVSAGILHNVKNVLAIHGWPHLNKGQLFSKGGPFFSAFATFSTVIRGKATHGGLPQNGLSPFPSAATIINEIEKMSTDLKGKVIISSCRINGGSSDNIIPDTIEIRGTIRYYKMEHLDLVKELFTKIESKIEKDTGCLVKTEYISKYYKPVFNDGGFLSNLNQILKEASLQYKEIPGVINETHAKTVSEDFSFYTDKKAGAMILLGLGDETPALHASDFDFPEDVLIKGILLFVSAAFNHSST